MLRLSEQITNLSVMSLRTGGKVAESEGPIINPNNLKVEGWYCKDSRSHERLVLLTQDVRDFVPQGIAINDYEELSDPSELVRLQEVLDMKFELIGKAVITNHKRRLGKVSDYAFDTESFEIQKIYVTRPVYKSLSEGQLSIDRSQIIEINDKRILVRDADVREAVPAVSAAPAST